MNPLAALVPDWMKKKKELQEGKTPTLPDGVTLPEGMVPSNVPLPTLNRAGKRMLMKQIRAMKKKHGFKAD